MSVKESLATRFGGNIRESMGVNRGAVPGEPVPATPTPDRLQGIVRSKAAAEIPLAKITPDPDQPREEFDPESLARLAESLRTRGQLQPIRVRWDEGRGSYVIVCGERRWRAAGLAGLPTMTAIIQEGAIAPAELLALQLVENCLREDLRPVEQARAFRGLINRNGWSVRQVAEELALSHSAVVKALALLDLPTAVQEHVETGGLAAATAYEISKLEDPDARAELAERVVSEGLTRAETVAAVKAVKPAKVKGRGVGKEKARKATERTFRTAGGYKVTVEGRRGVDDAMALAALREAVEQIERRTRADAQDAA